MLVVHQGVLVGPNVYYSFYSATSKIPTDAAVAQVLSAPTHPFSAINLYVIFMLVDSHAVPYVIFMLAGFHAVPACANSKNMSSRSEAT
jgi:hypothetical protein